MSLEQRLSTIRDICHNKRRSPSFEGGDAVMKRQRIMTELLPLVQLTNIVNRSTNTRIDGPKTSTATTSSTEEADGNNDSADEQDERRSKTTQDDNDSNDQPPPEVVQPDQIVHDYATYIQQELESIQQETKDLDQKQYRQKQSRVYQSYLQGLVTITQLNDLRDAPDAIMPHNFTLS